MLFLSACSSAPTPSPETPAPTKFALVVPSAIPTSTRTPTATSTATATFTSTPTLAPTRTRTPTSTPKPTNGAAGLSSTVPTPPAKSTATPLVFGDEKYGPLSVIPPQSNRTAHPLSAVNLSARGFAPTNARLDLVDIPGPFDAGAPRLYLLFNDNRMPTFSTVYQLYTWDDACNCRGALINEPEVTMLGLVSSPSEMLRVPDSGYNLGEGYEVLVLYADTERIVFSYTREDNPVRGYALYLEGISVESNLLALYQQMNSAGRLELPALRAGQAFARANGTEIKMAIRDAGAFMDPRSRKDWWRR